VDAEYYAQDDLDTDPDNAALYTDTRLAGLDSMALAIAMAGESSDIRPVGLARDGGGEMAGSTRTFEDEIANGADGESTFVRNSKTRGTVWQKKP
jgi:hypothetical protein